MDRTVFIQDSFVKSLTPSMPQKVTIFGNRAIKEVVKVK